MSTDGTDDTDGTHDTDGTNGSDASRASRGGRARRLLGLGAFDEQIADLTPAGHERVAIDPAPEVEAPVDTADTADTVDTVDTADTADTAEELPDGFLEEEPPGDPLVGRTGARFNSRARRSRRDRAREDEQDAAVAPQADPAASGPRHEGNGYADHPGTNGVSADRSATHRREEPPTVPFVPEPAIAAQPTAGSAGSSPVIAEAGRRTDVRPYIRTNGRTRPRTELALETMVSLPSPRPAMDDPEHVAIGDLCHGPRSVAEVAALLSLPLGVARVLIDDMAVEGLLRVHSTAGGAHTGPDLSVLERVLSGLHRL